MPRRSILTERQRQQLFGLPIDDLSLRRHYVLSDTDMKHIGTRRRPANRLGYALQICVLRYPGRLLQPGELIPDPIVNFVGAQLGLSKEDLLTYAQRRQTRYQHSSSLQKIYGYRAYDPDDTELASWIAAAAELTRSNEALANTIVAWMRQQHIIVPGPTTVERLCADALVAAENRICQRIAERIEPAKRIDLTELLAEVTEQGITRFVWLRQHEPGNTSRVANVLLDRLERIDAIGIEKDIVIDIPVHRVARLRRQGERYFADGMRDLPEHRRLAILAVCCLEWQAAISDSIVETHDRIVGKLYRVSERTRDNQVTEQRGLIQGTVQAFADIGASLVTAKDKGESLEAVIEKGCGWEAFSKLVQNAQAIDAKVSADPLDFVGSGYHRFRLYAPRMIRQLDIEGARSAEPLLAAIRTLHTFNESGKRTLPKNASIAFARAKWRKRLQKADRQSWETAVLFSIRDAFRSGDIWLRVSQRYAKPTTDLMPVSDVGLSPSLAVPLDPAQWIEERKLLLSEAFRAASEAARLNTLPNGIVKEGVLQMSKLERQTPEDADRLVLDLYREIPMTRITDVLLQSDQDIGFTEAFTDLRTGVPCKDKIGLLTVLLSNGVNLGLHKMAAATNKHTFWELLRIARWHVEEDAYQHALAMIVEAQSQLPMSSVWGTGNSASADGQFFSATSHGEALNLVNLKYGTDPGLKAYTHVSDQFAPFATQTIPATAHEAPYILDGLVSNDTGRRVKEQFSDTGGFSDHVFAMCSILGYSFTPRIRDLPAKRLYAFEPNAVDEVLRPMVAATIREDLITRSWSDVLQLSASAGANLIKPSQALKRLAAYPRQNELGLALREIGRVERTLFILRWIMDPDMQHRTQLGLNKGESHHALKRAINFHRRGEIRDRSSEGQHFRIAGMNLIAAIVIYWNTKQLGEVVQRMTKARNTPDPALLPHVSPLGWEHINLTGEYHWPRS